LKERIAVMARAVPIGNSEFSVGAMLAEIEGTFPMDEAVIKGICSLATWIE
jgi:hypothetical protein